MKLSIVVSSFVLVILLTASGCKHWYCCGFPTQGYVCVKDTTTKYFYVTAGTNQLQILINDSLAYYTNNGYTCTANYSGVQGACTLGNARKNILVQAGQQCSDTYRCGNDNCAE